MRYLFYKTSANFDSWLSTGLEMARVTHSCSSNKTIHIRELTITAIKTKLYGLEKAVDQARNFHKFSAHKTTPCIRDYRLATYTAISKYHIVK